LRILVRDIDSVTPWYVEKLGLRKLAAAPPAEPSAAIFRFKADGNSVILTTRDGSQTGKTPILFSKKIDRMRDVMSARGVDVGAIEQDRQGIHYFQIHDPEGNAIEVVEER
jgi:predicted enzyme related to lactoylglutathione lyase